MLTQDGFRMNPLLSVTQLDDLLPGAQLQYTACGCSYQCALEGRDSGGWIAIEPHWAAHHLAKGLAPNERLRIVYPTAPVVAA